MGRLRDVWDTMLGRPQVRSISYQDVWGTGGSTDLLGSSTAGALQLVPLYAAIRLIADQFASTPIAGFRQLPDGSRRRMAQPPALLTPAHGSLATWKTQLIMSLLTRGNAYGIPTSQDRSGWPSGIMWVDPSFVECDDLTPQDPRWSYNGRPLAESEIVHIPWLVPPGRVKGLSPLGAFKALWETGAAAQAMARNFYAAGGVPSGHFKNTAKTLTPEAATNTKKLFRQAVEDRDVLVTGNDWEYDAIGLPADQLAFVASLKLTATQIASIYGIAPEEIGGETGSNLTYSTTEMNDLKLSGRTMRPWYERCESTFNEITPREQYLKFNADALVRADLKTRMQSHQIALAIGLETNSEGRATEDRPPLSKAERTEWLATYPPPVLATAKENP